MAWGSDPNGGPRPERLTSDTEGYAVAEKKRGNGEGFKLRKRADSRWEARYTNADGKRRSVYAPTRKEIAAKLADALAH